MKVDRLTPENSSRRAGKAASRPPELRRIVRPSCLPDFGSGLRGGAALVRTILEQQVSLLSAGATRECVVHGIGAAFLAFTLPEAGEKEPVSS